MVGQTDGPMRKYERWDLRINLSVAVLTLGSLFFVGIGIQQNTEQLKNNQEVLESSRQALRSTAGAAVYNHQREVMGLFLDRSDLRKYFYDKIPIPSEFYDGSTKGKYEEYLKVQVLSEQILDQFDLIVDQFPHFVEVSDDGTGGWDNYMRGVFSTSPALCEYLDRYRAWYFSPKGDETYLMELARSASSCQRLLDGLRPSGKPWPPS